MCCSCNLQFSLHWVENYTPVVSLQWDQIVKDSGCINAAEVRSSSFVHMYHACAYNMRFRLELTPLH